MTRTASWSDWYNALAARSASDMDEPKLTARQTEVLSALAGGVLGKTLAHSMQVQPATIVKHMQHIRARLHAETTAHAVAIAVRKGLIP